MQKSILILLTCLALAASVEISVAQQNTDDTPQPLSDEYGGDLFEGEGVLTSGDEDVWTFIGQNGDQYSIIVSNSVPLTFEIYSPSGRLLSPVDDVTDSPLGIIGEYVLEESGEHQIIIRSSIDREGDYTITLYSLNEDSFFADPVYTDEDLTTEGIARNEDAGIVITNATGSMYEDYEICYVMISSTELDYWGYDVLDPLMTLMPGDEVYWTLAQGTYDVMLSDCNGALLGTALDVKVEDKAIGLRFPQEFVLFYSPLDENILIDPDTSPISSSQWGGVALYRAEIVLENQSNQIICSVAIQPKMVDGFNSLLGKPTIPRSFTGQLMPGESETIGVEAGFYDVIFYDCAGNPAHIVSGIDIKKGQRTIIYDSKYALPEPHIFTFVNNSDAEICEISFGNSSIDYGRFLYIQPGETLEFPLPPGVHDLYISECDTLTSVTFITFVQDSGMFHYPEDIHMLAENMIDANGDKVALSNLGDILQDVLVIQTAYENSHEDYIFAQFLIYAGDGFTRQGQFALAESSYYQSMLTIYNYGGMDYTGRFLYELALSHLGEVSRLRGLYGNAQTLFNQVDILNNRTITDLSDSLSLSLPPVTSMVERIQIESLSTDSLTDLNPIAYESRRQQALLLIEQGRYSDARSLLITLTNPPTEVELTVEELLGEVGSDLPESVAFSIDTDRGNAFSIDKSIPLLSELESLESLDPFVENRINTTQNQIVATRALSDLGAAQAGAGAHSVALRTFLAALQQHMLLEDDIYLPVTLHRIGNSLQDLGKPGQAIQAYQQALQAYAVIDDRLGTATVLNSVATLYADFGYPDRALDVYRTVLPLWGELNSQTGAFVVHLGYADLLLEQEETLEAVVHYTTAVDVFENMIGNAGTSRAISGLISNIDYYSPYRQLSVLLATENPDLALSYAERGRAVIARSTFNNQDNQHINVGLQAVEKEFAAEMLLLYDEVIEAQLLNDQLLQSGAEPQTIQSARSTLNELRQNFIIFDDARQIQEGTLIQNLADVASLEQIQASLPVNTTMLVYVLGIQDSAVFVITRDDLQSVILRDISLLGLQDLQQQFASDRENSTHILKQLYEILINDVTHLINGEHLIVVADGPLQYIPFAALLSPNDRYLIDDYTIRHLQSATMLSLLDQRIPQVMASQPGLVLANEDGPGLPNLQFAQEEAQLVATSLGTEARTNASLETLWDQVAGNRVLHISAHAQMEPFTPEFSSILLQSSDSEIGRLFVRDINRLPLRYGTDLVVLSGCDTGTGGNGEDFGILTQSFLNAGANEVVASLWSIDDQATTILMTAYYTTRLSTDNEAEALKQAMLVTRELYPNPIDWASFVLFGMNREYPDGLVPFSPDMIAESEPLPQLTSLDTMAENTVVAESSTPAPTITAVTFSHQESLISLTLDVEDPQSDFARIEIQPVNFDQSIEGYMTPSIDSLPMGQGRQIQIGTGYTCRANETIIVEITVFDAEENSSDSLYVEYDCSTLQGRELTVAEIPPKLEPIGAPSILDIWIGYDNSNNQPSVVLYLQIGDGEGDLERVEFREVEAGQVRYNPSPRALSYPATLQIHGEVYQGFQYGCRSDVISTNVFEVTVVDRLGNRSQPASYRIFCTGSAFTSNEQAGMILQYPGGAVLTNPYEVAESCLGIMPSRMIINEIGRVTYGQGQRNRLRSEPNSESNILDYIEIGEQFTVLDGPVCAEDLAWWQVNFRGLVGWTAEGSNGVYWIEPVPIDSDIDSACVVVADDIVNLRSGPGTTFKVLGQINNGDQILVNGFVINSSNYVWWFLENGAWVRADVIRTEGDCTGVAEVEGN